MIHFVFAAKVIDVKAAFLYRDLDEEIYIEYPSSMKDISKGDCIIFEKFIYDLMKKAREYNKAVES